MIPSPVGEGLPATFPIVDRSYSRARQHLNSLVDDFSLGGVFSHFFGGGRRQQPALIEELLEGLSRTQALFDGLDCADLKRASRAASCLVSFPSTREAQSFLAALPQKFSPGRTEVHGLGSERGARGGIRWRGAEEASRQGWAWGPWSSRTGGGPGGRGGSRGCHDSGFPSGTFRVLALDTHTACQIPPTSTAIHPIYHRQCSGKATASIASDWLE